MSDTPELLTVSILVRPVPPSEIQNSPPVPTEPYEMPHGLIRLGSVFSAGTEPSEIRLVCVKVVVVAVDAAWAPPVAVDAAAAA